MQLPRLLAVIALVALLAFGSLTAWSQQSESDTGRSQGSSPGRFHGSAARRGVYALMARMSMFCKAPGFTSLAPVT